MNFDISGKHAFADIVGTDPFRGDWSAFCRDAVGHSGLTVVTDGHHVFPDRAQTAKFILSESSLVATLSPDARSARVDCYTCGAEGQPAPAVAAIRDAFKSAASIHEIDRGRLAPGYDWHDLSENAGLITVTADIMYARLLSDEDALRLLTCSVQSAAARGDGNFFMVEHRFKPQGLTAVMAFRDSTGTVGYVDIHTYPEYNYVSYTGMGGRERIQRVLLAARPPEIPIAESSMKAYGRGTVFLPALSAAA